MTYVRRLGRAALLAALASTSGCALTVPSIQPPGQPASREWLREEHLAGYVKCQIHLAVQKVLQDQADDLERLGPARASLAGNSLAWLKGWGATVDLKIVVEDKASLAPNLTFNHTLPNVVSIFRRGGNVTNAQNSTLGLGATLTSDATRTEDIAFAYAFDDLLNEGTISEDDCRHQGGLFIDSDLKFSEFLQAKALLAKAPGIVILVPAAAPKDGPATAPTAPFTTFSYQVQFVVTQMGSVNPAWKLVNISVNPTSPFLSGSRVRTDSLLITLGKATKSAGAPPTLSPEANDAHLAALIGQAVAASLQSQQP